MSDAEEILDIDRKVAEGVGRVTIGEIYRILQEIKRDVELNERASEGRWERFEIANAKRFHDDIYPRLRQNELDIVQMKERVSNHLVFAGWLAAVIAFGAQGLMWAINFFRSPTPPPQ